MAGESFPLNGWQLGSSLRTRRRSAFTPQAFRRPFGEPTIARTEFFGAQAGGGTVEGSGDPGSYVLTGSDAKGAYTGVATPGAYSLTGSDAKGAYTGVGQAGSYALTGSAGYGSLAGKADAGSYALTGSDAQGGISQVGSSDAGSYSITGADAGGVFAFVGSGDAGSFEIVGFDADGTIETPSSDGVGGGRPWSSWDGKTHPFPEEKPAKPRGWDRVYFHPASAPGYAEAQEVIERAKQDRPATGGDGGSETEAEIARLQSQLSASARNVEQVRAELDLQRQELEQRQVEEADIAYVLAVLASL